MFFTSHTNRNNRLYNGDTVFFVRGRNQIFTFCLDKFYHHSQSDAPVPSRNKGSVFFHEFPFSLLFFGHLLYLLLSIPMSQFQSTFIRKMGGGGNLWTHTTILCSFLHLPRLPHSIGSTTVLTALIFHAAGGYC
jgi:hypothetical protein